MSRQNKYEGLPLAAIGLAMRTEAVAAATKYEQLSNREAGQRDLEKFRTVVNPDGAFASRRMVTRWEGICRDRAKQGLSRRQRILAKKNQGEAPDATS